MSKKCNKFFPTNLDMKNTMDNSSRVIRTQKLESGVLTLMIGAMYNIINPLKTDRIRRTMLN